MPATAARIGLVTNEFRIVTAFNQSAADRYGSAAREDGADSPVETFFDYEVDAQAMANQRIELVGPERRRFRSTITDPTVPFDLPVAPRTPAAQVIDAERNADLSCGVAEMGVDFRRDLAVLTVWG